MTMYKMCVCVCWIKNLFQLLFSIIILFVYDIVY